MVPNAVVGSLVSDVNHWGLSPHLDSWLLSQLGQPIMKTLYRRWEQTQFWTWDGQCPVLSCRRPPCSFLCFISRRRYRCVKVEYSTDSEEPL